MHVLTLNSMLRIVSRGTQSRLCGRTAPAPLNSMTSRYFASKKSLRVLQREESPTHKGMINIDMTSIKTFKELYGHCFIKQTFKFDSDTKGTGYAAGELGEHVKRIRRLEKVLPEAITYGDRRELNKLGFVWDARPSTFMRMLNGVSTYKQLYGDYLIPTAFTVPHGDERWSRELWGVALGNSYRNVLNRDLTPAEVKMMENSGVPISTLQNRRADMILLALNTYKALFINSAAGNSHNHTHNDTAQIGGTHKDSMVQNRGSDTRNSDKAAADSSAQRVNNMQYYFIQPDYVVPADDERWPEALRGCKLGTWVHNIRYKGYYENRRADFVATGLSLCSDTDKLVTKNDASTTVVGGGAAPIEAMSSAGTAGGVGSTGVVRKARKPRSARTVKAT